MIVLVLVFVAVSGLTVLVCRAGGAARRADARVRGAGESLTRRIGPVRAVLAIALGGSLVVAAALIPLGFATRAMTASFDKPIYHWVFARATAAHVTKAMETLTSMGNRNTMEVVVVVALLILGIAYGRRWPVPVIAILAAVVLQREGQLILTHVVPRTHPAVADAGVFPSGGVSRLIAVYGIVVALSLDLLPAQTQRLWRPRAWTGVALFAVFEAYSRVYLSLHWTTDVLTGLIFGSMLLAVEVAGLQAATTGRAARRPATTPQVLAVPRAPVAPKIDAP